MTTVLHDLARQVASTPDSPAVVDPHRTITYAELAARANAVADHLRLRGCRPGDTVTVALPRSVDYPAAVLGVWQAGATLLPIDLTSPPERIRYQRELCGSTWLLDSCPAAGPAAGLRTGDVDPAGSAYVMFTSGSTGRPKGVEVTHESLHHCVHAVSALLEPSAADRYAANQTFGFDISLLEFFVPLTHGGRALVTSEALQADPRRLIDWLEGHDVTVVHATPTAWRAFLPHLSPHRTDWQAVSGGEALTSGLADRLAERGGRVWNFYGPTEVTVWCTAGEIMPGEPDPLPVGTPLAGYRVVVLDQDGRTVPPGVRGEIHVGGPGVAIGYRGDPGQTAQRFWTHPELGRCYRTGDVGCVLPDGRLRIDGRSDRQVQLGGYRIELGEIECVALEHPDVELAVAHVVDGSLLLFAQGRVTSRVLRRHLAVRLPTYQLPAHLEIRHAFPLTSTQKIDRVALFASATG